MSESSIWHDKNKKNQDWFDAKIVTLQTLIEAKRIVLMTHRENLTPQTLAALRFARSLAKEECNRCANKFWLNLCSTIQVGADTGNIRAMFERYRKAIDPTQKYAPLRSLHGKISQDKARQLYSKLYHRVYVVSATALDQIERLLPMPESPHR